MFQRNKIISDLKNHKNNAQYVFPICSILIKSLKKRVLDWV